MYTVSMVTFYCRELLILHKSPFADSWRASLMFGKRSNASHLMLTSPRSAVNRKASLRRALVAATAGEGFDMLEVPIRQKVTAARPAGREARDQSRGPAKLGSYAQPFFADRDRALTQAMRRS